jgi:hypothetical protein
MRLSLQKGVHVVLFSPTCRKFGASRKKRARCGAPSVLLQVKALLWLHLERADRRAFLPGLDILDGVVVKDLVVFARDVADMWCCHDIGQGSQWM